MPANRARKIVGSDMITVRFAAPAAGVRANAGGAANAPELVPARRECKARSGVRICFRPIQPENIALGHTKQAQGGKSLQSACGIARRIQSEILATRSAECGSLP